MDKKQEIKNENTECNCKCDHDNKCDSTCDCGCNDSINDKKNISKHKGKEEIKKLKEEIEKLKLDNKNKEQEALVAKAELINYRKRKDEEVSKMLKFCNEDLVKSLLPTIDNFERAIKMDDDNLEDEVSKFLEGFKMVYCNFNEVLNNFEVHAIDEANVEFNPVYHNAIMVEKREGIDSGKILEVLQKGYMLKDKVIRPAMVKVSE